MNTTLMLKKLIASCIFAYCLLFFSLQAQPFEPGYGTKLKYNVWRVTASGREEYLLKVTIIDFQAPFGLNRIEFDYNTTAKFPVQGKIIMKPKAVSKGKYDNRDFPGGEKIFADETALWISQTMYQSLVGSGFFLWGEKANMKYDHPEEGKYPLKFNNVTTDWNVTHVSWDKSRTVYKMGILNDANNPLIVSFDAKDANNNVFKMRLVEVSTVKE